MQLFFTENTENKFTISSQESKHITRVLRKKEGDILNFTDGKGNLLIAKIISSDIKKIEVKVIDKSKKEKKHNYYLHIAISPTKKIDRFEWFLEKATEIGIDEITPIICDHSERKFLKKERCDKILISAMKQSLKFHKPTLNEAISFTEFIKKKFDENKYIAHCKDNEKLDFKTLSKTERYLILIGPEGDFSKNEIKTSLKNNFQSISLSTSRLRTETAAIVAVNTVNLKN
tara:strand:+ start:374 stop:1066 length:693 start_codon:yes stop_codon:yes gene_type:complete